MLQCICRTVAMREASTAQRPCGRGQVLAPYALPHGHRAAGSFLQIRRKDGHSCYYEAKLRQYGQKYKTLLTVFRSYRLTVSSSSLDPLSIASLERILHRLFHRVHCVVGAADSLLERRGAHSTVRMTDQVKPSGPHSCKRTRLLASFWLIYQN